MCLAFPSNNNQFMSFTKTFYGYVSMFYLMTNKTYAIWSIISQR